MFQDPLATFYRSLSTLLGTGLPIPMALRAAGEGVGSRRFRQAIDAVAFRAGAGTNVAEALAAQPETFDAADVALVEAGERTGTLDRTLLQLAEDRERLGGLRRRLLAGLAYPLFLYHAAAMIPPFPKLILEGLGAWLRPVLMMLVPFWIVVAGLVTLGRSPRGRDLRARLLGWLPICRTILRRSALARFLRVFASAQEAGMSATDTIRTAGHATTDQGLRAAAERGIAIVDDGGGDFGVFFAGVPGVDHAEIAHLRNGEMSGTLVDAVRDVAMVNEERVDRATQAAIRWLPVTMYLVVAAYVAFVVISTWAKLYSRF